MGLIMITQEYGQYIGKKRVAFLDLVRRTQREFDAGRLTDDAMLAVTIDIDAARSVLAMHSAVFTRITFGASCDE